MWKKRNRTIFETIHQSFRHISDEINDFFGSENKSLKSSYSLKKTYKSCELVFKQINRLLAQIFFPLKISVCFHSSISLTLNYNLNTDLMRKILEMSIKNDLSLFFETRQREWKFFMKGPQAGLVFLIFYWKIFFP